MRTITSFSESHDRHQQPETQALSAAKVAWTEVATGAWLGKDALLHGPSMSCRV